MSRRQLIRLGAVGALAAVPATLAGCDDNEGGQSLDLSDPARPGDRRILRLTFTPEQDAGVERTDRDAGSSATLRLSSSRDRAGVDFRLASSRGRVRLASTSDGVRERDGRSVSGAVSADATAEISVTATGFGDPNRPGDVLVLTSARYGRVEIEVWIAPTRGVWRDQIDGNPIDLQIVGVHAALLFAGQGRPQVVLFSPPRRTRDGTPVAAEHTHGGGFAWDLQALREVECRTWDPFTRQSVDRQMPHARNIFCSGHAVLPDGRLFVAGGHIIGPGGGVGEFLHVYDPRTGQPWRTEDARLAESRWYPTVTAMPDGRMLVTSGRGAPLVGDSFLDGVIGWNRLSRQTYEVFRTDGNAVVPVPVSRDDALLVDDPDVGTYPTVVVLPSSNGCPDGAVLVVERNRSWLYRYHTGGTAPLTFATGYRLVHRGSRSFPYYGSGVLLPLRGEGTGPVRLLVVGGQHEDNADHRDYRESQAATDTAELFEYDPARPPEQQAGWRSLPRMRHRRFLCDATLLADGSVLVTGGADHGWTNRNSGPVHEAELFDPETLTFRPMARARIERRYHSVALLLPDGTLMKAGSTGGFDPDQTRIVPQFRAELFFPPYLWKGPRPIIDAAPARAGHGSTIDVGVTSTAPDGALSRINVAVIRPGSVTHGNNMDQRFVYLTVERQASRGHAAATLTVRIPKDPATVPPGPYLLVVRDAHDVPSAGRLITVGR